MVYDAMPLYPSMGADCDGEACVRVPMFGGERCPGDPPDALGQCRRVTLENPCRPGECAEVLLGLDACGNLVVCVHRQHSGHRPEPCCDRRPCRPRRHKPGAPCRPPEECFPPPRPCDSPDGRGRGRLYGSWR